MNTIVTQKTRENSYDAFRVLFALFVVFHHSAQLVDNSSDSYIRWGENLSHIGLNGFFILSGFLIFQSAVRSKKLQSFATKRILRIFPGLLVVLFLCIGACSLVYSGTWLEYWQMPEVWTYIPNNLSLYHLQHTLPGVFEQNSWGNSINGPIWTLAYEFSLYIAFSVFVFIRERKIQFLILISGILAIGAISLLRPDYIGSTGGKFHLGFYTKYILQFSCFFFLGALVSMTKATTWPYKKYLFWISAVLLAVATYYNDLRNALYYVPLVLVVIVGGSYYSQILGALMKRLGDVSYGVYIYSFPIQQMLIYYLSPSVQTLIIASTLLSLLFGYLSWHYVEKYFSSLKHVDLFQVSREFLGKVLNPKPSL